MSDVLKASVSLSNDLLEWIDALVDGHQFANRSQVIEYCIACIRENESRYLVEPGEGK